VALAAGARCLLVLLLQLLLPVLVLVPAVKSGVQAQAAQAAGVNILLVRQLLLILQHHHLVLALINNQISAIQLAIMALVQMDVPGEVMAVPLAVIVHPAVQENFNNLALHPQFVILHFVPAAVLGETMAVPLDVL